MENIDTTCYICLEPVAEGTHICKCHHCVHPECMATWQFNNVGKSEEMNCRFCNEKLPDWRPYMMPKHLKNLYKVATPSISVMVGNTTYKLPVFEGAEGKSTFIAMVKFLLNIDDDDSNVICDFVFTCKHPFTGKKKVFKGLQYYDVAFHCAKVAAAQTAYEHVLLNTRHIYDTPHDTNTPHNSPQNTPHASTSHTYHTHHHHETWFSEIASCFRSIFG